MKQLQRSRPSGAPAHLSEDFVTIIVPRRGWPSPGLAELWTYRDLVYFLTWRDIKVRYKQTALGAAWAVIQPLLAMAIFTVIFGRFAGLPSDGVPYPLLAYTALLPWNLFSSGLTRSTTSLVGDASLIRKVYFPRLAIPVSAALVGLLDFVIAFAMLGVLMLYFGLVPRLAILTVPLFVLLALATALGVGLWLSALNVRYRDVGHAIPFLVQTWMFASPVAYAGSVVPEEWRMIYALNPMVGVVEGFRWAILGTQTELGPVLMVSLAVTAALLVSGLFFFRRMEETFADVV